MTNKTVVSSSFKNFSLIASLSFFISSLKFIPYFAQIEKERNPKKKFNISIIDLLL